MGEYDGKLWRVLHHYVDEARAKVDMSDVTDIGVDETSAKRGQDYISHVVDLAARKVLFAVDGKGSEVLKAFREDLKAHKGKAEQIEEVCLDMSPAFIKGLREYFPKAHLTFDRFHVMKLVNDAVDITRRGEIKDHPELKNTRYAWMKNRSNLTVKQGQRLAELKNSNLQTAEAYRMKLTLQDFYEQANPRAAREFLLDWCEMARTAGLEAMAKVAKTLETHLEGVLRWFTSKITNGLLEGINSLIQAAKAKARGYRTARNLIAIVYLIAGKLDFKLAGI